VKATGLAVVLFDVVNLTNSLIQ